MKTVFLTAAFCLLIWVVSVNAQTSSFTYQGKLTDGTSPANGQYDLSLRLFDAVSGGNQIGTTQTLENVQVTGGIFTVTLDFGSSPFTSNTGNYLDISVRPGTSTAAFTLLAPRQPITNSPYALQTLRATSAETADSATNFTGNLGGDVTGTQSSTVVTRLQNRFVTGQAPTSGQILMWNGTSSQWEPGNSQTAPGSPNYIQNTTSLQATSNFYISGDGRSGGTLAGNLISADLQYNIGGTRIINNPGLSGNLFVGRFTGSNGANANNAMFGDFAGNSLNGGTSNSFFGQGVQFELQGTGRFTTSGSFNSFFGHRTGENNTTGSVNSFFGTGAGINSTTGGGNSFFGHDAGNTNSFGSFNTALGKDADFASDNLSWATAIGSNAVVSSSDTIVLGKVSGTYDGLPRPADVVQIPGNLSVGGALNANGSTLTNLNASSINTGTLDNARLGVVPIANGGTGSTTQNFVDTASNQPTISGNKTFLGGINVSGSNAPALSQFRISASPAAAFGSFMSLDASAITGGKEYLVFSTGGSAGEGQGKLVVKNQTDNTTALTINPNGNVGLGTTSPEARLHVGGGGFGFNLLVTDSNLGATTFDLGNTSTGGRTWRFQSNGGDNTAGRIGSLELWNVGGNNALAIQENGNIGIGHLTPTGRLQVDNSFTVLANGNVGVNNTTPTARLQVGGSAQIDGGSLNLIGGTFNNFSTSGTSNMFMKAAASQNGINFGVAGNAGTNSTLFISHFDGANYQDRVILNPDGSLRVNGTLSVGGTVALALGVDAGTQLDVCFRLSSGILVQCSSSIRYKTNINNFQSGLALIERLRPVTYDWKADGKADMGLIAEEVAEVEPLLATQNDKGEIEGVRYDRIGVVLINAVKEQQAQIEAQQKQIEELKAIVCSLKPAIAKCER